MSKHTSDESRNNQKYVSESYTDKNCNYTENLRKNLKSMESDLIKEISHDQEKFILSSGLIVAIHKKKNVIFYGDIAQNKEQINKLTDVSERAYKTNCRKCDEYSSCII